MKTVKRKSVRKVTKSKVVKKKASKKKVGKKVAKKKVPIKQTALKGSVDLKSIVNTLNVLCGLVVKVNKNVDELKSYLHTQKLIPQGNTREAPLDTASLESAPVGGNTAVKQGTLFDLPQQDDLEQEVEATVEQVKQVLQELSDVKGIDSVSKLLADFGYVRFSEIQKNDFANIIDKANEWLK